MHKKSLKELRIEAKAKKDYKQVVSMIAEMSGLTKKEVHKYFALVDIGIHIGQDLPDEVLA